MNDYLDSLEIREPGRRDAEQGAALARQVAHARKCSPYFERTLQDSAPREIDSRQALADLPVLRKSQLQELQRQALPFGGLTAVQPPRLRHVFASPGPIYEPGGGRGDDWRFARALFAAGFRQGDLVHNCFAYHFTPAGAMVESGAFALGCAVVPAGPGQTEAQVQTIADLRPDGYVGTPSFLKIILERGDQVGADLSSLRKGLVSGEALPATLYDALAGRGVDVRQCYATADLGLIAYETPAREGLVLDEGVIVEIVRPGTGDPVPDGEVGEVVVTTLNPDYPLIRFATGDLSAILPGTSPCGRTNRRIRGWLGRADQTTKVRGMFVHPGQVAQVLKRHPEVLRGRLTVDRADDLDTMVLQCELSGEPPAGLAQTLGETIREVCKLRGEIVFHPPGALPNDGKVIEDLRPVG
jgi:phenylacetate-CoA ligase